MTEELAVASIEAWEVGSLRLTTFLSEDADIGRMKFWWHDVVGAEAEESTARPRERRLHETGSYDGRLLSLTVTPNRVDWIITPPDPPPDETPDPLATMGNLPDALKTFERITRSWFDVYTSFSRLAFGATLIQRVSDLRSGYETIDEYLHSLQIDVEGSSDLFYQINRPRQSANQHFTINRLSKWSVVRSGLIQIAVDDVGARRFGADTEDVVCRLELDISTVGLSEIRDDSLSDTLEELIAAGREIATNGDRF